MRRDDPRCGWLILVGGAFLTIAVAFSRAQGIFHPYYVAQLAPFTAALVGATAALMLQRGRAARVIGAAAVLAGVATELLVLDGTLRWWAPLLAAGGVVAAAALVFAAPKPRALVVARAIALLLLAPAVWSAQTLGHATSGTFPAGGPAATAMAGGPGAGGAPPGGGDGPARFGGASGSLTEAVAYARANGGTIAVSGQSGAAGQLIASGADVVAIGGFSGRESQVSAQWLAVAVQDGRIRYVLTDGAGGLPHDGRTGADEVMAIVQEVGTPVSGVDGLYDLQGLADALRSQ